MRGYKALTKGNKSLNKKYQFSYYYNHCDEKLVYGKSGFHASLKPLDVLRSSGYDPIDDDIRFHEVEIVESDGIARKEKGISDSGVACSTIEILPKEIYFEDMIVDYYGKKLSTRIKNANESLDNFIHNIFEKDKKKLEELKNKYYYHHGFRPNTDDEKKAKEKVEKEYAKYKKSSNKKYWDEHEKVYMKNKLFISCKAFNKVTCDDNFVAVDDDIFGIGNMIVGTMGHNSESIARCSNDIAVTTGIVANAVADGYNSIAASTGQASINLTLGINAISASTACESQVISLGTDSVAVSTGNRSFAVVTESNSCAIVNSTGSIAIAGAKGSIAIVLAPGSDAKGVKGSWLLLSDHKYDDEHSLWAEQAASYVPNHLKKHRSSFRKITKFKLVYIGRKYKPNTLYGLYEGKVLDIDTIIKLKEDNKEK